MALSILATALAVVEGAGARLAGAAPVVSAPVLSPVAAGVPTRVAVAVADPGAAPVQLAVVAGFGPEAVQVLRDDGLAGDAVAGDGTHTGAIAAQPAGTLVRYRVVVGATTWPVKVGKRRYAGHVVARPAVVSNLPVLDWYLAPADAQWLADNRSSKEYVPAVLAWGGTVLDGVEVRNQGGFTSAFSPKPNFKFKLPKDQTVAAPFFTEPVDEFVADADHEDPVYGMGIEAQALMEAAGVPKRMTALARVERAGSFYGVYRLYEEFDGTWIDRLPRAVRSVYEIDDGMGRLIDEGSLAALQTHFSEIEGDGSYADLRALVADLDASGGPARAAAVVDRFDLPSLVDYLAMGLLTQHVDAGTTNTIVMSDARDGRWQAVPNDLDLTLGLRRRTRSGLALSTQLLGTTSALSEEGDLAQLVARRVRTLHDAWFADDRILAAVGARADLARPDAALDRAAWPSDLPSIDQGLTDLAAFLAFQRRLVADATADGALPAAQDASATAVIAEVRAAGDDGDLVELANPSTTEAVDLSGWTLDGDAAATLPGGSVIPAGGRLVVPASRAVVAARSQGILVAGSLDGPLPVDGGSISLRDALGGALDAVAWGVGGAWPAPGTSGRSIEAKTLGADRTGPGGWQLSPAAGGTPGRAGASTRGLRVDVWAGRLSAPAGQPVPVRVVVTNDGPGLASAVVVDGPGPDCDQSPSSLAPGASRTSWCSFTPPTPSPVIPARVVGLTATARSTQQPDGVVDRPLLAAVAPDEPIPGVALESVRLGDGELRLGTEAAGPPTDWRTSRLDLQFAPLDGSPVAGGRAAGHGTAPASPAPLVVPLGRPGVARAAVRSLNGGTLSPSVFSPPITARARATWPFASPTALVDRWYLDLAGRPPSAGERTLWTTALADATDPADVVLALLADDRWERKADPLVRLYLAHFGRVPDATGLRYWLGRRRAGVALASISQRFVRSSEFARRYAGLDAAAFVTAVYRNVFDRDPDPGGLDHWTRQVERGRARGDVVLAFSESTEGIRRKAATVDATVVWFALHGTVPDVSWSTRAVAWLAGGGDLGTVVESARSDAAYASVVG